MIVSGAAKGSAGGVLVLFCQIAPAALVAKDLLPVDPKSAGVALE
jgi:hypothetical protein